MVLFDMVGRIAAHCKAPPAMMQVEHDNCIMAGGFGVSTAKPLGGRIQQVVGASFRVCQQAKS